MAQSFDIAQGQAKTFTLSSEALTPFRVPRLGQHQTAHPRESLDVTANTAPFHKFLNLFLKTGQNARCLAAIPTTKSEAFSVSCRCRLLIYLVNPIDLAEAWDKPQIFVAALPLATYTR